MITGLQRPAIGSPRNSTPSPRELANVAPTVNAHPDSRLVQRFSASSHNNITSMMQGHDIDVPKHRGKDVCLTWALKGACTSTCKRKEAHVRYPLTVNKALHELLDKCGVANPDG